MSTEAKDTVMEGNQIAACYGIKANTTPGILWEDARKAVDVEIATRQAEISFRAGMEKVVEWIRKMGFNHARWVGMPKQPSKWVSFREIILEEWQEQLKEWGIKVEQ